MISGVIFDIDGVLCDSEPFICEAAMRMLRERYGITVQPSDFLPFVGAGENRYIGGVAEKYGVQIRLPDDKVRTYDIYLEIIRGRLQPLPGVLDFVAECRRRHLRLGVASAADRMKVVGNLREIGVPAGTFDAVITGSDVVRHKPDPECYLKTADRIGVPPATCLVVEDATNGIRAAKSAGAFCLGLTTSFSADVLRAAGADWTAPTLAAVPTAVFACLGE